MTNSTGEQSRNNDEMSETNEQNQNNVQNENTLIIMDNSHDVQNETNKGIK